MMNNEMMRQLQARMQKLQEELASQTVEGTAGGGAVTVTISEIGMGPAQAKLQRVKISPEAVDPEDIETDLLCERDLFEQIANAPCRVLVVQFGKGVDAEFHRAKLAMDG